ncbi:hypothetical protein JMJ77_0002414 [Colletotrichum scovillei]|uniref:Uncharacterized protein n=1 Tax=Colletotrichum scovillei TaxID=1209932 RepID=A0A9P7UDK2_9PEZI|nr:hypothetical protein JMJ77_0002414 [Colletotrichum scovillei]KAG7070833.1 hypothetical protein JMJ76_0002078 [Colletotrichum scovillei]KAG7079065.1 hypothetical protein JMJ78_0002727 [Colletotrichum scovillei]
MAQKLRRNVKDSKIQDPFSSLFVLLVALHDLDAVDKSADQPMARFSCHRRKRSVTDLQRQPRVTSPL